MIKLVLNACLFVLFSAFTLHSTAQSSDFGVASNADEFLPIEQAYQALPEIRNDALEVNWSMAPGYFLYQHQFKAEANNGRTMEKLPLSFQPGERKYDDYYQKELEVYYLDTFMSAPLPDMEPPYELKVTSQGCADAGLCYPPRKQYFQVAADGMIDELPRSEIDWSAVVDNDIASTTATVTTPVAVPVEQRVETESPFLPYVLLGALLGGMILNLMPCVFPVLSLKALSFASSKQHNQHQHLHGWAYTAGVVLSFVVAAVIIMVARETGESLGWGFQLQQPLFVAGLTFLFLFMGLMLYGVVSFGTQFMGVGQNLTSGTGLRASFFTGVLAAVVASPCTAPFMATALGVAITQPAAIAVLIFAVLGFGMALPFLALSYSPRLADMLPKPGMWMEVLKQLLAFPLLATAIWLLWVLGNQTGSTGVAYFLLAALLFGFAFWLAKFSLNKPLNKTLLRLLILLSVLAAGHLTWKIDALKGSGRQTVANEAWEEYSPARLAELRSAGKTVFVNLTADWCITCKVNERVAFSSDAFFQRANELGVTLMMGDWTNADEDISALLETYNRSGVPLYLMFPSTPNGEPEILPQILSAGSVVKAMERASQ